MLGPKQILLPQKHSKNVLPNQTHTHTHTRTHNIIVLATLFYLTFFLTVFVCYLLRIYNTSKVIILTQQSSMENKTMATYGVSTRVIRKGPSGVHAKVARFLCASLAQTNIITIYIYIYIYISKINT